MNTRTTQIIVGVFMLAGLLSLVAMALKVSGLTNYLAGPSYRITASFDNVGDLKIRAPVTLAGVKIGQVTDIRLNASTFKADVMIEIDSSKDNLPTDTAASILTQGLLGANYIGLTPGFDQIYLKAGSRIEITHPALILENLIGQFLFNIKSDNGNKDDKK